MLTDRCKIILPATRWERRALLFVAANFFARKLGIHRRFCRINIKLIANLKRSQHCRGLSLQMGRSYFEIQLHAGLNYRTMVRCLGHEMIHIQQWTTRKMVDLHADRHAVRWGKRNYYPAKIAYSKHPWEIQAYRQELQLYRSFLKFWEDK